MLLMASHTDGKTPPGYTGEEHPELFATVPTVSATPKPGQLSAEQLKQYTEDGFLIVPDFFKDSEIEPCKEAVNRLVAELADKLFAAGKIKNKYEELGFDSRLTHINKEFPGANILLHASGKLPVEIQNLWTNERLLNMVEQLIGPDISGHCVWNLRTKTPHSHQTDVPWHQDNGYLDTNSYNINQPSVWIPFVDANSVNGGLEFVKGTHKKGKVAIHECCHGDTWYVTLSDEECEKTLGGDLPKDIVATPVPVRGLILFNNFVAHRSLPNQSNIIRWSVDLRFQSADAPQNFYGVKDCLPFRLSKDPNYKPDFDAWNRIDRTAAQMEVIGDVVDEFTTNISGPWMGKWDIMHENRHTAAFKPDASASWHVTG